MMAWHSHGNLDEPGDDLSAVYGDSADADQPRDIGTSGKIKNEFAPWHHPVKQFVRREQWANQVKRLIGNDQRLVTYLTLPGEDMLDVRILGELLKAQDCQLECLGFNSTGAKKDDNGSQLNIQSAIRQEGLITDKSITLTDRIEEIAQQASQAENVLCQWRTFDVVNLDLCGHLSTDGNPSTFDALNRIVDHQRSATRPWLLMITTRVHPEHLSSAKEHFDEAIQRNIDLDQSFVATLSESLGIDPAQLRSALPGIWSSADSNLTKLYAVGFGKYLLHLLHCQVQDPAHVELSSCLAYRVHASHPDMLSLAFRIEPKKKKLIPAGIASVSIPPVEVVHANQIARKAGRLGDVDEILRSDATKLEIFTNESENLLRVSNYDVSHFRAWVKDFRVFNGSNNTYAGETDPELAHEVC